MSSADLDDSDGISLPLTRDEALVLFELLNRWIEDKKGVDLLELVQHDAELWALNAVLCMLESKLAEPFGADYSSRLDAAIPSAII